MQVESLSCNTSCQLLFVAFLFGNGCQETPRSNDPSGQLVHNFFAGNVFVSPDPDNLPRAETTFDIVGPSSESSYSLALKSLSCGCTDCEILDPQTLPGKAAKVRLGFQVRYERARRTEGAVLTFEGHEGASRVLQLTADVFPRVNMSPYLLHPPELHSGEVLSRELEFSCYEPVSEQANSISAEVKCQGVSIESLGETIVETQGSVRKSTRKYALSFCNATSVADSGGGFQSNGALSIEGRIRVTHGPFVLERPVTWRHVPYIEIAPSQPFLNASRRVAATARIRLTADEPYTITFVECTDKRIKIISELTSAALEQTLVVSLDEDIKWQGASCLSIVVTTNHPKQPILNVPINVLGDFSEMFDGHGSAERIESAL